MNLQQYGQSFSQGQITIPKSFRNNLGLGNKFSYKLTLDNTRIILEPAQPVTDRDEYRKKLLALKGDWFNESEWQKNRRSLANRYKNLQ